MDIDLNGLGTAGSPHEIAANANSARRKVTKRRKYVARACQDCKRRKVKCSGNDTCNQCWSRDIRCRYSPPPPQSPDERVGERRRYSSLAISSQSAVPQARNPDFSSATWDSTTHSDSRVDGLSERMETVERMITHLLNSSKGNEASSPSATFQTPGRSNVPEEDEVANQFAARAVSRDDLSLSSQVAAMSALLSRPPSPKPDCGKPNARVEVLVEFPDPSTLQHLLDVYFRDMDNYFPFLHPQDTESRIYSVIRRLGYSSYNRMLVVTIADIPVVALTCIMLALAECVDSGEGACDGDTKPGWERYLQSCRAIHHVSMSKTLDLDVVGAQCLVAAYLMQCEALSLASDAILATWQLATSIRLNDKEAWPKKDAKSSLRRQQLWWTIYFLDRQISRRSGTAYHIRDTEFDVDDFTSSGTAAEGDSLPQKDRYSSIATTYFQALISLAKLWGIVWDTFFAVGATKKGDWMEIEIMDARILNTRRQLPKGLAWDSHELATHTLNGEDEPQIRRRLQIYTRLELLRMLIRQNPLRPAELNPETAQHCARLAREIIGAHVLYISRYPEARAIGYFTTSSTVECIYHLAHAMHYSKDDNEHAACVTAFNQAHGILVKLSAYNNVAKRALKALEGVIQKWGSGNPTGNSRVSHGDAHQIGGDNHNTTGALPQIHESQGNILQTRADGFDFGLADWNLPLDSLYGNDFDFRPDTQF